MQHTDHVTLTLAERRQNERTRADRSRPHARTTGRARAVARFAALDHFHGSGPLWVPLVVNPAR